MNSSLRTLYHFILVAAISLASQARGYTQELTPVSIQLKWLPQFQFAGYYAAQLKGFYREEGLDVKLIEGGPEHPPVESVLSGKADFGITGSDLLNHRLNDEPVVVLAAIFQHSPYVFMSMADKNLNAPSDLAGKRMMASTDQGWLLLRALFLKEGISERNIKLLPHSFNSMDLVNEKVDAISAYVTVEPHLLEKKGYKVNLIRPIDYGIDFYGDVLFTHAGTASAKPKIAEKMIRASMKGWEYALAHKEELATYLAGLPNVRERGITKEDLIREAIEMEKLIMPSLVEIGHMNPGRWQHMLDIYKQLGLADADDSLEGFIFQSFEEKKVFYFDILLYILGIASFLVIVALIWNGQLRKQVQNKTLDLQKEIETRKAAEERLELAIQAAGLGVWDWNPIENSGGYDATWTKSLGYEPETFMRDGNWLEIVHPDDRDAVAEVMARLLDGSLQSNSLTYRLKTADGRWKWILAFSRITKFTKDGKAENIIGTHLDIDVIKQKEIELEEIAHELQKTNAELEKFAYITSHNLRAPVVNLMSLTEMQAEGSLPEDLSTEINDKIHSCVQQLHTTLADLIEIVASKANPNIEVENVDIEEELKLVLSTIEKQVNESGAHFDLSFTEARYVNFPRRYLTSVLLNLLTNSIKYRSEDRRLNITIKTRLTREYTILYFSDNGSGIDMNKYANKIFGLYQRFHKRVDGKGLGLYMIKSQVEAMHGKIEVDSMPDVGTTFKVYFPNSNPAS